MKHPIDSQLMLRCATLVGLAMVCNPPSLAQNAPRTNASHAATAKASYPVGPGSLEGMWQNAHYVGTGQASAKDRRIRTIDGKLPPLLPWAEKLVEKRVNDAAQGNIFSNTLAQCLPGGIPEMMYGAPYSMEFLETPGQLAVLFEEQNHFRIIRMNAKHNDDPDPTYMGDSVGHWDGDTLVVDTIGLKDTPTLDMVGTPHTESLHVIEHFRRTGATTMQDVIWMEDKGAFTKPWEIKAVYNMVPPGTQMTEYICENNRNAPNKNGDTGFQAPSRF